MLAHAHAHDSVHYMHCKTTSAMVRAASDVSSQGNNKGIINIMDAMSVLYNSPFMLAYVNLD